MQSRVDFLQRPLCSSLLSTTQIPCFHKCASFLPLLPYRASHSSQTTPLLLSCKHFLRHLPQQPHLQIQVSQNHCRHRPTLLSVLILATLVVFYYCRRRNSMDKSLQSDSHHLFGPSEGRKVGVSATNSDFLYLGTLVNSHRVNDDDDDAGSGNAAGNSPYQKLGSPELQPLPPLAHQFSQNHRNAAEDGPGAEEEEEEEEFYSPRGSLSLGDKESLTGTGSGSRRVFPALAAAAARISNSSTPSYPSSNSGSPTPSLLPSKSPSPSV